MKSSRGATHPALLACEDVTRACLELRRAGLRAQSPSASEALIERRLRAELARARRAKLAAYRRNA
jgi:hypothetical protein